MASITPPRPPAPPRPPVGGRSGTGPAGPGRGPVIVTSSPSTLKVLLVFLVNLACAIVAAVLTPFPRPVPDPSSSVWVGFLLGLFGCTLLFGLMQFLVAQQHEAGTFSDWNIPVSKVTLAKFVTAIGWGAGGLNCFVLAHNLASAVA